MAINFRFLHPRQQLHFNSKCTSSRFSNNSQPICSNFINSRCLINFSKIKQQANNFNINFPSSSSNLRSISSTNKSPRSTQSKKSPLAQIIIKCCKEKIKLSKSNSSLTRATKESIWGVLRKAGSKRTRTKEIS